MPGTVHTLFYLFLQITWWEICVPTSVDEEMGHCKIIYNLPKRYRCEFALNLCGWSPFSSVTCRASEVEYMSNTSKGKGSVRWLKREKKERRTGRRKTRKIIRHWERDRRAGGSWESDSSRPIHRGAEPAPRVHPYLLRWYVNWFQE